MLQPRSDKYMEQFFCIIVGRDVFCLVFFILAILFRKKESCPSDISNVGLNNILIKNNTQVLYIRAGGHPEEANNASGVMQSFKEC